MEVLNSCKVEVRGYVPPQLSLRPYSLEVNPTVGGSSSRMVHTPVPSEIVALLGVDKTTLKVSLNSDTVSPITRTVIVFSVSPAANGKHGVRRASISFRHRNIVDGQTGYCVIIGDRPHALGITNGSIGRI